MTVANWVCLAGLVFSLSLLVYTIATEMERARKRMEKKESSASRASPNAGNIGATGNGGVTPDRPHPIGGVFFIELAHDPYIAFTRKAIDGYVGKETATKYPEGS